MAATNLISDPCRVASMAPLPTQLQLLADDEKEMNKMLIGLVSEMYSNSMIDTIIARKKEACNLRQQTENIGKEI